jgi:hypothetical protein
VFCLKHIASSLPRLWTLRLGVPKSLAKQPVWLAFCRFKLHLKFTAIISLSVEPVAKLIGVLQRRN